MGLSGVMNVAMSGMLASTNRLGATAQNVANMDTPGYRRMNASSSTTEGGGVITTVTESDAAKGGSSNVDLGTEMLDMMEAETSYKANASVFEAGADMWDVLLTINRDDDEQA
ncbi:flagellar basal body rod protein FlgC [Rhizobium sp. PAMB 3174]